MRVDEDELTAVDALAYMDSDEVFEQAVQMAELLPVIEEERELWEKRARALGWKETGA